MRFVEFERILVQLTKKWGSSFRFMQVPTCCLMLQFYLADTPLKWMPPLPPPRRWEEVSEFFHLALLSRKCETKSGLKNTYVKNANCKYSLMSLYQSVVNLHQNHPTSILCLHERLNLSANTISGWNVLLVLQCFIFGRQLWTMHKAKGHWLKDICGRKKKQIYQHFFPLCVCNK